MRRRSLNNLGSIALAALSILFFNGNNIFAAVADDLIASGKQKMINDANIQGAFEDFSAALALDPNNKKANFWYAAAVIFDNPEFFGKKTPQQAGLLQDMGMLDANKNLRRDAEGEPLNSGYDVVEDIIRDNSQAVFSGSWTNLDSSTSVNTYGANCSYIAAAASGGASATWSLNITVPGTYRVYFWNVSRPGNIPNAEYTVNHASGNSVVNAYQGGGSGWRSLGSYKFNTATYPLTLSNRSSSSGQVNADAVKVEYLGAVIDDGDAAFSTTGSWTTAVGGGVGDGNFHWSAMDSSESKQAIWSVNLPLSGRYVVSAYVYSSQDLSPKAEYIIAPQGAQAETVFINQQNYKRGNWAVLGIFDFPSSSGNTVTLKSSAEGVVVADSLTFTPIKRVPDATVMQNKFGSLVTQLNDALGKLNFVLSDTSFSDTLNVENETVYFDYADAKAFEAMLYFFKAQAYMNGAYNADSADMQKWAERPEMSPPDFLNKYPNLLNPVSDAVSRLDNGKAAFLAMIESYFATSDFMRNTRSDSNINQHAVKLYKPGASQSVIDESLMREAQARSLLGDIRDNLNDHSNHLYVRMPVEEFAAGSGSGMQLPFDVNIDFAALFTPYSGMRNFIQQVTEDVIIHDGFSDFTLGGIFPTIVTSDWNALLGAGAQFKEEAKITWNGDAPAVELKWDSLENSSDVLRYEVYRSATPLVDTSSQRIAVISDPNATSYTDTSLGANSGDVYYYRIYTYFLIQGSAATSSSLAQRARIRAYVNVNYAGSEEDGSKAKPFKDLGDALRHEADDGTKVLVAEGRYFEYDQTLGLWNKPGLVLEGGYSSDFSQRDVAQYETIIDANGANTWSCVSISNMSGNTVDGFTITNTNGQSNSAGVNVSYSSNIAIRNCKITNSNRGIIMYNSTNVLVENCSITGRKAQGAGTEGVGVYGASSAEIKNCKIKDNNTDGITASDSGSNVNISESEITGNKSNGITAVNYTSISVSHTYIAQNSSIGISAVCSVNLFNNLIYGNGFYGIWLSGSTGGVNDSIINNTITENNWGGIIYCSPLESLVIRNNIISKNNTSDLIGAGYGIDGDSVSGPTRVIEYNNVYGHLQADYRNCGTSAGQSNNISSDPLFASGPKGNFYLTQSANPNVDSGKGTAVELGLSDRTTSSAQALDTGIVDRGYHYPLAQPQNTKWELTIDFGSTWGIWTYANNSSWSQLHNVSPKYMLACDLNGNHKAERIIDFGSTWGIWVNYDNGSWQQIHNLSAEAIIAADIDGNGKDDLVIDFGQTRGVWVRFDGGSWKQLHSLSPECMAAGDLDDSGKADIVLDFGSTYGVWVYYNDSTWQQLHSLSPEAMVMNSSADIIFDFGSTYGIWKYSTPSGSPAVWSQVHNLNPKSITTGNVDADAAGKDELIIDFGPAWGIWMRVNDSNWQQVHSLTAEEIITGDIDGNGKKDIIIDFGSTYGIWIRFDNGQWSQVHGLSPEQLIAADIDGQ